MNICIYLLGGFIALMAYQLIIEVKVCKVPVKQALTELLHYVIFILTWPIDFVWCMYVILKDKNGFKNYMQNFCKRYY